jgi:hypothetical protein
VTVRPLQVGFRHQGCDGGGILVRQAQLGQGFFDERFQAAECN